MKSGKQVGNFKQLSLPTSGSFIKLSNAIHAALYVVHSTGAMTHDLEKLALGTIPLVASC